MTKSKPHKSLHASTARPASPAAHSAAHLQAEAELVREVTSLTQEVQKLKDMELIQIFKHPFKFLWFSFLKGVMVGFGSVLGASLVVGIFLYLLTQISLVPVIGDFVQKVINQIQPGTEQTEQQETQEPSPQSSPQPYTPNSPQK